MAENNTINMSSEVLSAAQMAMARVVELHHEYLTPEHLLWAFLQDDKFSSCLKEQCGIDLDSLNELIATVDSYLGDFPSVPAEQPLVELSRQFNSLLAESLAEASAQGRDSINVCDVMFCMSSLKESVAAVSLLRCLEECGCPLFEMLNFLADVYGVMWVPNDLDDLFSDDLPDDGATMSNDASPAEAKPSWMRFVHPVGTQLEGRHPLVGRTEELERMM